MRLKRWLSLCACSYQEQGLVEESTTEGVASLGNQAGEIVGRIPVQQTKKEGALLGGRMRSLRGS